MELVGQSMLVNPKNVNKREEMKMSNIIYLRVSTTDQTTENQKTQFEKLGLRNCKFFIDEGLSGKNTDRPALQDMLDYVREGDTLYVVDESRLGRNQSDVAKIKKQLDIKDVELISLETAALYKELGILGLKSKDDDGSMDYAMKLYLKNQLSVVFNFMSDFRRKQDLEKQKIGIARAKEEGKYKGSLPRYRPDTQNRRDRNIYEEVVKRLSNKDTILSIAEELGICRNTVKSIKKRITGTEGN